VLNLSEVAKIEKNKVDSNNSLLFFLDIEFETITYRLVRNNENIFWNKNEYVAFPFNLGEINENANGELPTFDIVVQDTTRTVQGYVEQANGGKSARVILRALYSHYLTTTTPELEEVFAVLSVKCDAKGVTFNCGSDFPLSKRFPARRYLKDFCPYRYKDIECACISDLTECNKTLIDCRERNNSTRFGGCPGISNAGNYYA